MKIFSAILSIIYNLMCDKSKGYSFCRAMLCISAAYAVMRCLSVCVCASVTFVDHVKMTKHILEILSPSDSHIILDFPCQTT